MIHEASTIAMGDSRALKKTAELLEGISAEIAGIYADRTGGDPKAIRNLMFAETWMTADQAKDNGFVDTILKDGKVKAVFDSDEKSNMSILAKLFPGNDQVAQLEASLADAETLRADLETAQARIIELTGLTEANVQLQADLSAVEAKLADAEKAAAEHADAIASLTEQAEITNAKVAVKASELLASQGHPAPVELVGDKGDTPTDILAQYEALTGPAKWAFLAKHSQELAAAARLKK
jgi:hypothetical protein